MNNVITRSQAIARGLNRYFTGRPCKRGHYSERYVNAPNCIQCKLEGSRANPQSIMPINMERPYQRVASTSTMSERVHVLPSASPMVYPVKPDRRATPRPDRVCMTWDNISEEGKNWWYACIDAIRQGHLNSQLYKHHPLDAQLAPVTAESTRRILAADAPQRNAMALELV